MQNHTFLDGARAIFARYWGLYRDRAISRNELAYMSEWDIELLARDCGISPGQFKDMMRRGPHAADELAELMQVLGIDEASLKSVNPGTFNDMKLICAECWHKSDCRRSLKKGTAGQDYVNFCNNADLLVAARASIQRAAA